jgi:hypothetical protein
MSDLRAPEQSTLRVQGLPTADNRWAVQCLNCEAPVTGPFCANCGQRAVPPNPTVRELAGDAFSELSGWDGKFAETFRKLLTRPGLLTREWIEGKRVSFIAPIRLYLTTSLIYFVVSSAAPNLGSKPAQAISSGGFNFSLNDTDKPKPGSKPSRVLRDFNKALATNQAITGPERDSALAAIATAPAILRPAMRRGITDPGSFGTAIRRAMPNVFLGLVPVFALVLALFYRRRRYPEHLFFAIHLATFLFIARTLGNLPLFTHNLVLAGIAQGVMLIWMLAYGVIALRRVYGGSVPTTILKGVGICVLYGLIALPVILGVAFVVVST